MQKTSQADYVPTNNDHFGHTLTDAHSENVGLLSFCSNKLIKRRFYKENAKKRKNHYVLY